MLNIHLIRRQISGSLYQSVVLILCVILSMITLVSLGGFSSSVHTSLLRDAQALHAADIIIHSHAPFSQNLLDAITSLHLRQSIESARVYEFYSIVQTDGIIISNVSRSKKVGRTTRPYRRVHRETEDDTDIETSQKPDIDENRESLLSD